MRFIQLDNSYVPAFNVELNGKIIGQLIPDSENNYSYLQDEHDGLIVSSDLSLIYNKLNTLNKLNKFDYV